MGLFEKRNENEPEIKMELYSMRDKLTGYIYPIPFQKKEIAQRYFKEQVQNNMTIKTSPNDFEMYKIGEYNTKTGEITMYKDYELVAKGEDYAEI